MRIGFRTPYKHLPNFSSYVESLYTCIDISKEIQEVDYIFSAPNYPKCLVDRKLIEDTKAKAILTPSTGTNHIVLDDITVFSITNDPILTEITSTAEHNLFLTLKLVRNIEPIRQLSDLTLGILGYGRLGKMLKERTGKLYKDVKVKDKTYEDKNFFSDIDILSINVDLNSTSNELVDRSFIERFKKKLFIVNTSRGEVVNEEEVIDLLYSNKVLGYATDVIQEEHTNKYTVLKSENHRNLFVTPHTGGTAIDAQEKAYKRVIEKLNGLD